MSQSLPSVPAASLIYLSWPTFFLPYYFLLNFLPCPFFLQVGGKAIWVALTYFSLYLLQFAEPFLVS